MTCLFANVGTDLRGPLRPGASDADLAEIITRRWRVRDDRYSEDSRLSSTNVLLGGSRIRPAGGQHRDAPSTAGSVRRRPRGDHHPPLASPRRPLLRRTRPHDRRVAKPQKVEMYHIEGGRGCGGYSPANHELSEIGRENVLA